MTEQEKNAFGCMGVVALIAFVWLSVSVVKNSYVTAFHPEMVEQQREAQAAEARRQKEVADAEAAAKATKVRERDERDRERRRLENQCIRELGYDACRRIYHPTAEERAAERAVVDRASRIAEAYRDQ